MARFKPYNYDQTELLAISFKEQILPGTFEYTLNHLVERELDTSIFHHRYQNDETGRPAYDPALLLKIVLLAYSRGALRSSGVKVRSSPTPEALPAAERLSSYAVRMLSSWHFQPIHNPISPRLQILFPVPVKKSPNSFYRY